MEFFSKEKGSVNLLTLIIIAVLVACLVFVLLEFIKSNNIATNSIASQNLTSREENGEDEPEEPIEEIDYNSDDLSYQFLKLESTSHKNKNIIYSPLSIKYGLNMLLEGAEGDTKKEIKDLLGDSKLTKYKNINKVLSFANGVCIKEENKEQVLDSYNDVLKDKFEAEIMYDE